MPTKKEVEKAWKEGKPITIKVSGKCIICNKGEVGDIHMVKLPEGVEMCIPCSRKYIPKDYAEKQLGGIQGYFTMYCVDVNNVFIIQRTDARQGPQSE